MADELYLLYEELPDELSGCSLHLANQFIRTYPHLHLIIPRHRHIPPPQIIRHHHLHKTIIIERILCLIQRFYTLLALANQHIIALQLQKTMQLNADYHVVLELVDELKCSEGVEVGVVGQLLAGFLHE